MELTCLPCLAWARLRQHDVAGACALARQSASPDIALPLPFPFPEMARAVLAWVAWKDERYSQVEELAGEVLETRRVDEPPFPFAWICLWPLIAVRLAEGRTAGALTAARRTFAAAPNAAPPAACGVVSWRARSLGSRRARLGFGETSRVGRDRGASQFRLSCLRGPLKV